LQQGGWYILDFPILFGLGFLVDTGTGALSHLEPSEVMLTMTPEKKRIANQLNSVTGKLNVAVSDLSPENVSKSDAAIVADWLRGGLVATGVYTVVERSAMQKVLSEQAFQQTGCTSEECAVKLGKLLNVQRMVVGSFGKFLDSYVLNIRVVDVESGQVIYSDKAKGKTTDEVETNIKSLALRLSQ